MKTYKWFVAAVAWLPLGLVCPEARGADPVKAAPAGDKAKARPPAAAARPLVGLARAGDIGIAGNDLGQGAAPADLWGHNRAYCTNIISGYHYNNGNRWLVQQWPQAVVDRSATVNVVFAPREVYCFDPSAAAYQARYGVHQTLVHDPTSHVYRMMDPDGTFWEFHDGTGGLSNLFKRRVTPGGRTVTAISANNKITRLQLQIAPGRPVYEQYDYSYGTESTAGSYQQLTSVTLSCWVSAPPTPGGPLGKLEPARQASYTYYSKGSTCGMAGDLRTVVCRSWVGGGWAGADTYYYRYYRAGERGGFAHGLKYAFQPLDYSNLAAANPAITNPDELSDSTVAKRAGFFFQYGERHDR